MHFSYLALQYLFRNNLADALLKIRQEYGSVVRLPGVVLLSDPAMIQHVTVTNWRNYRKSVALQRAKPLLGNGLLTAEGSAWQQQRRMMAPAFHRNRIALLAETMVTVIDEMMLRWEVAAISGAIVDISAELNTLALSVAAAGLFSTTISAADMAIAGKSLHFLLARFRRAVSLPGLIRGLPLGSQASTNHHIKHLDAIVYGIIVARRDSAENHDDLLDMLMGTLEETSGRGLSDLELRDEVMTILIAGHETTASHLAWTLALLAQHPVYQSAAAAEVAHEIGTRRPVSGDIGRLPLIQQIIDESLRLYPPGWLFARETIEADQIGDLTLKAGTTVLMSPYVVHRDNMYWENPAKFEPERFAIPTERPRFSYWPFGGGPRQCIGRQFALMESRLVIAMLLQRFEIILLSDEPIELLPSFTLRPKHNILARLRLR